MGGKAGAIMPAMMIVRERGRGFAGHAELMRDLNRLRQHRACEQRLRNKRIGERDAEETLPEKCTDENHAVNSPQKPAESSSQDRRHKAAAQA